MLVCWEFYGSIFFLTRVVSCLGTEQFLEVGAFDIVVFGGAILYFS